MTTRPPMRSSAILAFAAGLLLSLIGPTAAQTTPFSGTTPLTGA